ncbi:MAG TPA: hypothetical protein D7H88_06635, partial [Candidatus Poseidoniales archaeon]
MALGFDEMGYCANACAPAHTSANHPVQSLLEGIYYRRPRRANKLQREWNSRRVYVMVIEHNKDDGLNIDLTK